jgi:hypothetical protein
MASAVAAPLMFADGFADPALDASLPSVDAAPWEPPDDDAQSFEQFLGADMGLYDSLFEYDSDTSEDIPLGSEEAQEELLRVLLGTDPGGASGNNTPTSDQTDEARDATEHARIAPGPADQNQFAAVPTASRVVRRKRPTTATVPPLKPAGGTINKRRATKPPVADGLRPFQCSHPGCDYAAAKRRYLIEHERVHSGERPCVLHCTVSPTTIPQRLFCFCFAVLSGEGLRAHTQLVGVGWNEQVQVHLAWLYIRGVRAGPHQPPSAHPHG